MSADDRTEMSEEMAEFWAEVKDLLPRMIRRGGFVSAHPLGGPDVLDIFTVWWGGYEEHIATLHRSTWGAFNLVVDLPGVDGRTITDVSPRRVVDTIETAAADQVRKHLPGAWGTGTVFEWDGTVVTSFEDAVNPRPRNFGEFVEYICGLINEILVRKTFQDVLDRLLFEGAVFTAAAGGGRVLITTPGGVIGVTAHGGEASVELSGEHPHGPIRVIPGEHGVTYSYNAMNDLIYTAKENR